MYFPRMQRNNGKGVYPFADDSSGSKNGMQASKCKTGYRDELLNRHEPARSSFDRACCFSSREFATVGTSR